VESVFGATDQNVIVPFFVKLKTKNQKLYLIFSR